MFGGFGGKKSSPSTPSEAFEAPKTEGKSSGGGGSVHGFDPTALERAAKAARDLDSSKNARGALEVIKEQEKTKQHELDMKRAEYMAAQEQLAIQRIRQVGLCSS
jgi:ATPase family AAA domain-containing protein 3A/B